MSARMGNRYYPHSHLPTVGTLSTAIRALEKTIGFESRTQTLRREEIESLLRLIELRAWKEDWDGVIENSSWGVWEGCGTNAQVKFYRAWLEGLKATNNVEGLEQVALHLLRQREEAIEFLALALMALSWAGRKSYARVIHHRLHTGQSRNVVVLEALAIALCEQLSSKQRTTGVKLLQRLVHSGNVSYFCHRTYVGYALENDCHVEAADAYTHLQERFPRCPEPYWGAAAVAMEEEKWGEAALILQELLSDNPDSTDALIALARCFELTGDLLAARDLLVSNRQLFHSADYDFNVTLGMMNKKLHDRYGMANYRNYAVEHLAKALLVASRLGLPESSLHLALRELGAEASGEKLKADLREHTKNETPVESRFWILVADEVLLRGMLKKGSFLVNAPKDLEENHLVFIALHSSHEQTDSLEKSRILGLFKASSPGIPDAQFGRVVKLSGLKVFDAPVDFEMTKGTDFSLATDSSGSENFSMNGMARFVSVHSEAASRVVHLLELTNAQQRDQERIQYAV